MNNPLVIGVSATDNIIIAKDGAHIQELCLDLYHNKGNAKLCHSIFFIPAHLIPAISHSSNTNRSFNHILRIWKIIDCQIVILSQDNDVIEKRIARYFPTKE